VYVAKRGLKRTRGILLKHKLLDPQMHHGSIDQRSTLDAHAVKPGAIAAVEVFDVNRIVDCQNSAVATTDRLTGHDQLSTSAATAKADSRPSQWNTDRWWLR
jgi:hypothetical protein